MEAHEHIPQELLEKSKHEIDNTDPLGEALSHLIYLRDDLGEEITDEKIDIAVKNNDLNELDKQVLQEYFYGEEFFEQGE